jgi:hypothetical protein
MTIYPKRPRALAPRPFTAVDTVTYTMVGSIDAMVMTAAYVRGNWPVFALGAVAWLVQMWCILVRVHEAQEKR